jgi:hypothetical protein
MSFFGQTLHYSKLTAVTRHASAAARWCIIVIRAGISFRIVCMSFSVLEQKAWGRIVFSVAPDSQGAM